MEFQWFFIFKGGNLRAVDWSRENLAPFEKNFYKASESSRQCFSYKCFFSLHQNDSDLRGCLGWLFSFLPNFLHTLYTASELILSLVWMKLLILCAEIAPKVFPMDDKYHV